MKTYHLATFGCQMNEYDSRLIAAMLDERGLEQVDRQEDADCVVVNTCSVREKAEDTAFHYIKQLAWLKKKKPAMRIAVVGCMAKNKGENIPKSFGHVDWVLGPDSYRNIDRILLDGLPGSLPEERVHVDFDTHENYLGMFAKAPDSPSAFLTVQRGCNRHCSFCIVPHVRGPEKNRNLTDILNEAKQLAEKGISELTLLGQTVNSWKTSETSFAELLSQVSEVEGIRRVRFTSPHPRYFDSGLVDVMHNNPRVCRHTHLPVQSGRNAVLKNMKRQYTRELFLEIIGNLRAGDPDFGISTDLIAGYPGESEKDFRKTLDLIKEARFDSAFLFAYSPRSGTRAFDMPESIGPAEKNDRLNEMIRLQNEITLERNSRLVGTDQTVMIEGPSRRNPKELVGKTDCFRKVVIPLEKTLPPGTFLQVKIKTLRGRTLRGIPSFSQ